jgi:Pectinacetylesterase
MNRTTQLLLTLAALLVGLVPRAQAQVVWPDLMLNGIPQTVNGWTWIPIAGAKCRQGGNTGIAYRKGSDPSKLMITLQGGGACFSGTTCAVNPPRYGFDEFKTAANNNKLGGGVWSTSGPKVDANGNPVQPAATVSNATGTYSHVFIPYCTGDVFAGNRTSWIPGVWGEQAFVGYKNMELFINYITKRLLPKGTNPEVKLAGISAGGFGALLNAPRLRDKLPATMPMSLLLDSSPPMDAQLFPSCQQQRMSDTWNLASTVVADCDGACTSNNWLNPFFENMLFNYQSMGVSLASNTYDIVIRSFAGLFGDPACVRDPSEAEYTAGLLRLRDQMDSLHEADNTAVFIRPNNAGHVFIDDERYYKTVSDGVTIQTWVAEQFRRGTTPAAYREVGLTH